MIFHLHPDVNVGCRTDLWFGKAHHKRASEDVTSFT